MATTGMVPADAAPFALRQAPGELAEGAAKLAGEIGSTGVQALLAQANRTAVRKGAAGALGTMSPKPHEWYAFDAKDQETVDWYPQGLTGGEDSGEVGVPVFAVSWYFKPKAPVPERGIRVTFLSPSTLKYQHVLLVEAKPDGSYGPIDIHAGGIAWYGDLLYVADTTRGLRVFDVNNLLDLRTAQKDLGDDKRLGRHGGRFHAYGYRYVLPQSDFWRLATPSGAVFSFAAIDRSAGPDLLITGEYDVDGPTGRAVRYELAGNKIGPARDCFQMGAAKIQGAVSQGGTWYLSQAFDADRNGRLLVTNGAKLSARPFPIGPEDLTVQGGRLWSVTEFKNRRVVFGVSL
ncbi:hypothetical protein [Nonomuraea endophytica]|uniref:Secreted protein n=1 Tax=Nonomuraea endophytica TaxID=714136 RepID=A0A7W8A2X7_9ACTN|nr:hypothetical protein [Nonomuraea endophytica]MBB5078004.1 hypothetical protein [Nonomuraea endophytica]